MTGELSAHFNGEQRYENPNRPSAINMLRFRVSGLGVCCAAWTVGGCMEVHGWLVVGSNYGSYTYKLYPI